MAGSKHSEQDISQAKLWWRSLSINEMKAYAKLHLSESDRAFFMSYPQYLSRARWDDLHVELWLRTGKQTPQIIEA